MAGDDYAIAMALNAGLRRLIVTALAHEQATDDQSHRIPALRDAFEDEISRLAVRAVTGDGENVELTAAVRQALKLFVAEAYREASTRSSRTAPLR